MTTLKSWSDEYFVYDYEDEKLLRKFKSFVKARAFADSRKREAIVAFQPLKSRYDWNYNWAYSSQDNAPIESNPAKTIRKLAKKEYLELLSIAVMEKLILFAKDQYHNTDTPIMRDNVFDALERQLRLDHPKSKVLRMVGAAPSDNVKPAVDRKTTAERKERLPHFMGSMDKLNTQEEIEEWTKKFKGPYIVMAKLDGNSLLLTNKTEDKKTTMYTRGNGVIGQNISAILPKLKLPALKGTQSIRFEGLLPKSTFAAMVKANPELKAARNTANGILLKQEHTPAELKAVELIALQQISPNKKLSQGFKTLKSQGFKVVKHVKVMSLTPEILSRLLAKFKKEYGYEMDGLVVYDDNVHPENKEKYPPWAFAYKENEDPIRTVVKGIRWVVSRHNQIKPTVLLEPVMSASGVELTKATGHNAKYIFDNKIGKGAIITVVRSGDVIPYIVSVIKGAKKAGMPHDIDWEWNASGVNILATTKGSAPQMSAQLVVAFRQLGVEKVGGTFAMRFAEQGLGKFETLFKAKAKKLAEIIGPNRGETFYRDLHGAVKSANILDLMIVSGAFGIGIGETKLNDLLTMYPDFAKYSDKKIAGLTLPKGFGQLTMDKMKSGMPEFRKFLTAIGRTANLSFPVAKTKSNKLNGRVFTFTGVRNDALSNAIVENGGLVKSMQKSTTQVIVKDKSYNSDTVKAAKARNIPITLVDDVVRELTKLGIKV